jgi:galactose mutarotase-like enzyme
VEDRRGEGLSDPIRLICGDASARISRLGAEAVSWRIGGRHLLWRKETSHWDRVAPVLFPCVGWSRGGRVAFDGVSYPMPVHGFASASPFDVVDVTQSAVTLELQDTAATFAHYPFKFRLRVRYTLAARGLHTEIHVVNAGPGIMPYSCGLHPGFEWPFAGGAQSDYRLRFSLPERAAVPVIAEGGLFSSRLRPVPLEGRLLRLEPGLFAQEALCFLDAQSSVVAFEGPEGVLEAKAENFRHWAFWSRPGAPFLCIEAWSGHGDPEGFTGEFRDKPSIDLLAPGETRQYALDLRFSQP